MKRCICKNEKLLDKIHKKELEKKGITIGRKMLGLKYNCPKCGNKEYYPKITLGPNLWIGGETGESNCKDKELENLYEDELPIGKFEIPKKRDWSNLPIYLLVIIIIGMLIYLYLTI